MRAPSHGLSRAQLQASLAASLANWDGHTPLWLFAYGSLIWNPEFSYELRQPALLHGYHRRLCLRSVLYRGTPECPGVVAGLDRGGSCHGVAYRIAAARVRGEFESLWEREMLLGSYAPTWVKPRLQADARQIDALAFVVRRDANNYCGRLGEAQLLDILRRAGGKYGSSFDYLQRTVTALHEAGLRDPHLERLARLAARGAP